MSDEDLGKIAFEAHEQEFIMRAPGALTQFCDYERWEDVPHGRQLCWIAAAKAVKASIASETVSDKPQSET